MNTFTYDNKDQNSFIVLDEIKFKKFTKKISDSLKQELGVDIKLSQAQELTAKALGFRNLHELQAKFSKEKIFLLHKNQDCFLDKLSKSELYGVFSSLIMRNGDDGMWGKRALSLVDAVLDALLYLKNNHFVGVSVLNVDTITQYMTLDAIISIHKYFQSQNKTDLQEYEVIHQYLNVLPGFQFDKERQHDVTFEQHAYLVMQLFTGIHTLKKIEDNNFIVFDQSWFISDAVRLNEKNLKNNLNDKLKEIKIHGMSWFLEEDFEEVIDKIKLLSGKSVIRVSDFLIFEHRIFNKSIQKKSMFVFDYLIKNYTECAHISEALMLENKKSI